MGLCWIRMRNYYRHAISVKDIALWVRPVRQGCVGRGQTVRHGSDGIRGMAAPPPWIKPRLVEVLALRPSNTDQDIRIHTPAEGVLLPRLDQAPALTYS